MGYNKAVKCPVLDDGGGNLGGVITLTAFTQKVCQGIWSPDIFLNKALKTFL